MKVMEILSRVVLIFLMGTAYFLYPMENITLDCPITWGWLDCNFSELYVQILLLAAGLVAVGASAVSLFFIYRQYYNFPSSDIWMMISFFLLVVYTNPSAIFFSPIFPALLCLVWVQYAYMCQNYFVGAFLLSLSALFYAPLIWLFPLAFILLGMLSGFNFKNIVIVLSGMIVPLIYILAFRYLLFDDTLQFMQLFAHECISAKIAVSGLNFPYCFLIVCIVIVLLNSTVALTKMFSWFVISVRKMISTTIFVLLNIAIIYILFSLNTGLPAGSLVALPFSFIVSYRLTQVKQSKRSYIDVLLLLSALIISRVSLFVS